jgi:hypothetical protein
LPENQGIGSLNCFVRLRVVYGCEGNLRPNLVAEILEHGTIKILGIVDCDLLWNSITTDDVLPKESLNGSGGYVGNGLRFNPFGEVLHCSDSKSVVSLLLKGQDGVISCEGCVGALERWENRTLAA